MDVSLFFQFLIYILGSILLVVLIVLGIKLIMVINKMQLVVDNVDRKVNSLNRLFSIIDNTTDRLSLISDKIVDYITVVLKTIFRRKKKKESDEEDE